MIEREPRYKKTTGKHGKAFVKDEAAVDAVTEELKKEEPVEVKKPKTKKVKKFGIVITSGQRSLNVRTAPVKDDKNVICVIPKSTKVAINVVDSIDGWYNITVEATPGVKVTGYVMSRFIKEV